MVKFNPSRRKEGLPYREVAECFLLYNGKIVAQDAGKYLSLPGGGIDEGESPEQGAKRELIEEIGAKIKGKLQVINIMTWDWDPSWANNEKRKGRYMQFRGEKVYSFFGVIDSFVKPTDVDQDAWTGKKLMSLKKAREVAERCLEHSTPENQYAYNLSKTTIIATLSTLNGKKLLRKE